MKLSHYSKKTVITPESRTQVGLTYKPAGLWVSVDGEDDWPYFCRAEEFGLDRLANHFRVELESDANILMIETEGQLHNFTAEWRVDIPHAYPCVDTINWCSVAEQYQGIIIAPYQWGCRTNPKSVWYYGWDCASGCIWDAEAIASVDLLAGVPA